MAHVRPPSGKTKTRKVAEKQGKGEEAGSKLHNTTATFVICGICDFLLAEASRPPISYESGMVWPRIHSLAQQPLVIFGGVNVLVIVMERVRSVFISLTLPVETH